MYTIKDVAEKTGLSPYTIRYYAKEGLLPTIQKNSNGVRIFRDEDLESIYIIECLKNCGMKIKEIKQFIDWTLEGDSTIDKRLEFFQEKYSVMQEKISMMNETLEAIRYKIWFYQTSKDAGTIKIHDNMDSDEIPADMKQIRDRMNHVERVANRNFWKIGGGN